MLFLHTYGDRVKVLSTIKYGNHVIEVADMRSILKKIDTGAYEYSVIYDGKKMMIEEKTPPEYFQLRFNVYEDNGQAEYIIHLKPHWLKWKQTVCRNRVVIHQGTMARSIL